MTQYDDDYDIESDYDSESFEVSNKNISFNSTRSANTSHDSNYARLRADVQNYTDELHQHSPGGYRRFESCSHSPTKKLVINHGTANDQSPNYSIYVVVCIVAALLGALAFYLNPSKPLPIARIECPQFKELSKQYKNQDISLWKSLKKNIENVVNQTPAQPGVFLLAYHDTEGSKRVIANILNATAYCMQSRDPIELDGSTFASDAMLQDYGEIIATYRQRLEREGVMYVSDIEKMPSKAAQAFHTICDTVTPLVERSVIFFTMHVHQSSGNMSPQEIHHLIETQLENNWIDINHDTLNALIGRITDQVFLLHSENDVR